MVYQLAIMSNKPYQSLSLKNNYLAHNPECWHYSRAVWLWLLRALQSAASWVGGFTNLGYSPFLGTSAGTTELRQLWWLVSRDQQH